MRKLLWVLFGGVVLFNGAIFSSICFAQAETTTPATEQTPATAEAAEEIVIIGEQPGPGLWKIYKGDHVLWLLGGYSPLPKKLQWRSQQAETALTNSQEVILYPQANVEAGFFSKLAALPSLIGLKKNPDGATLQEIVPEDIYARWLMLKEKYIGKDNAIEKERPIFAGSELLEQAQKKAGFENEDTVVARVQELAKKHKIKTTVPSVNFPIKSPSKTIKNFKHTQLDDVACFSKMLEFLSKDLDNMRLRANAWATGDTAAFAELPITDHGGECFQTIMNSSFVAEEGMKEMPGKLEDEWLNVIDNALTNNQSSFAIIGIGEILKKGSAVEKMKAKGYRIEGFGFEPLASE